MYRLDPVKVGFVKSSKMTTIGEDARSRAGLRAVVAAEDSFERSRPPCHSERAQRGEESPHGFNRKKSRGPDFEAAPARLGRMRGAKKGEFWGGTKPLCHLESAT